MTNYITLNKNTFLKEAQGFIEFLINKFNDKDGINLSTEISNYHWPKGEKGFRFEETYEMIKRLREKFSNAISLENEDDILNLCTEILNWGGVGVAKKNLIHIENMKSKSELLQVLKKAQNLIKAEEIIVDGAIPTNSGFSKIYTCLYERFVIYDSRVAAAMCFLMKQFYSKDSIPETIKLGKADFQSADQRDPGPEFPMISGNDKKYLESNIKAAWIIEKLAMENPKFDFKLEKLIFAYQTAFFVKGKNLPF
ncbi:MAG: hypothetical protein ABIT08_08865 [Bacteroidia bacterium]